MVYLKNFKSHSDYETAEASLLSPSVAYDKEHVHFKNSSTDSKPKDTSTLDPEYNYNSDNLDPKNNDLIMDLD